MLAKLVLRLSLMAYQTLLSFRRAHSRSVRPLVGGGNVIKMNPRFDLATIESWSEIPACRGRRVLTLLIEVDPISGKESERYPGGSVREECWHVLPDNEHPLLLQSKFVHGTPFLHEMRFVHGISNPIVDPIQMMHLQG